MALGHLKDYPARPHTSPVKHAAQSGNCIKKSPEANLRGFVIYSA